MNNVLPVLIIGNSFFLPSSEFRIDINKNDKKLFSIAESYNNSNILLVNYDLNMNNIIIDKLPKVGVLGVIKLHMDLPNGKSKIVIEGVKRVLINSYIEEDNDILKADISDLELSKPSKEEIAYLRLLYNHIEKYSMSCNLSLEFTEHAKNIDNIEDFINFVVSNINIDNSKKLKYINQISNEVRSEYLLTDIEEDVLIGELEKNIDNKLAKELDKSQKEYILREKIRIIKEELGDINAKDNEVNIFKDKIDKLKCSKKIKERLRNELSRYESLPSTSPEIGMIRSYIETMLALPFGIHTKDNLDLEKVRNVLDKSHYGLENVKQRIVEYLAVKKNTHSLRSPIICLVGPPGVGKTTFAKSIAVSLNRNVTKISVGGINDEAEIVGHRRTYIGAECGLIIQGMKKAGSMNPVFIIDEIDKMTKDIHGDPASSLLEVLDPEQNKNFVDHYLEEDFDLSMVMFITTANYYDQIPNELRDRLEIIELSSYTEYEKLDICKNYLIPKQLKEHGLDNIKFSDEVILNIIRNYTKEAGVRDLDRNIATVLRKIVTEKLAGKEKDEYLVTDFNIEKYLGKKKISWQDLDIIEHVGVVNGLAYTSFGGDTLPIEVVSFPGSGKIILTGSLGDVMKESANIAFDYIKANYLKFKIDYEKISKQDFHIHVPEGAVPKDGPSAGVTITTTLLSLLKDYPVHTNTAMTGEMTLRGKVLPIGGLKEKVIGAHRNGIRKIFIPSNNLKDLEDVPVDIKNEINFILVDKYMDIYNNLFIKRGRKKHDPRNIRLLMD